MGTSRFRPGLLSLPAAAAAMPLAFGPWFRDAYGMPKLALAGVCAAVGAAALAATGALGTLRSRLDGPLAAFALATLLSAAVSCEPDLSRWGEDLERLFGPPGMAACACVFYLGLAQGRAGGGRLLLRALAFGAIPVSAYALAQLLGWEPFAWRPAGSSMFWAPIPPTHRSIASLATPSELGGTLALTSAAALTLALDGAPLLGWGSFAGGWAALAASGSRGAALGGLAGLGAVLWLGRLPAAPRHRRALWAGFLLAGLALLPFIAARSLMHTNSIHFHAGLAALEAFARRPVAGWGVDAFVVPFRRFCRLGYAYEYFKDGVASHAHDDWLQVLATMGTIGAAAYLWLHMRLWRALREAAGGGGAVARGAAGAAAALFVAAKFGPPSFCSAWLGSALIGCALGEAAPAGGAGGVARRWLAPANFLLAAAVCAVSAAAWVRADRLDVLGRLARASGRPREAAMLLERAAAAMPGVFIYRADLANLLWDAAADVDPQDRRVLLARASESTLEALARRPSDSALYRLLAAAELRRFEAGEPRLAAARAALDASLELDPLYPRLGNLARIPALQGDLDLSRRLEARLQDPAVGGIRR